MGRKWINTCAEWRDNRWRSTPAYSQWTSVVQRGTVGSEAQKRRPTCADCTLDADWSNYDVWLEWAKQQVGFLSRDLNGHLYQIDKDLLVRGNKHYSPDTCVFVPIEINTFLSLQQRSTGAYPVGVTLAKGRRLFRARVRLGKGGYKFLGSFSTPDAAFAAYKIHKEARAKELAEMYRDSVDQRVIAILLAFKISMED